MEEDNETINIEVQDAKPMNRGFKSARDKWAPVIEALKALPKGKMLVIDVNDQTARTALNRYGYKKLYSRITYIEERKCGLISANKFEAPKPQPIKSEDDL